MLHNQIFKFITVKKCYQLTEKACMSYHCFGIFLAVVFFGYCVVTTIIIPQGEFLQ